MGKLSGGILEPESETDIARYRRDPGHKTGSRELRGNAREKTIWILGRPGRGRTEQRDHHAKPDRLTATRNRTPSPQPPDNIATRTTETGA